MTPSLGTYIPTYAADTALKSKKKKKRKKDLAVEFLNNNFVNLNIFDRKLKLFTVTLYIWEYKCNLFNNCQKCRTEIFGWMLINAKNNLKSLQVIF